MEDSPLASPSAQAGRIILGRTTMITIFQHHLPLPLNTIIRRQKRSLKLGDLRPTQRASRRLHRFIPLSQVSRLRLGQAVERIRLLIILWIARRRFRLY